MNFEMLLDEIINLSGEEQLNYLSKFKDYDFSKEELFEIFSLVEEVNYEKFYLMFKELLSKLGMLDYYLLVINMNKDLNNFNKYLKRVRKTSNFQTDYRLIGKLVNGGKTTYASIRIDNPNPNRGCNLGG